LTIGGGCASLHHPGDTFAFDTDDWMRFERNTEADYEAHAGGASWSDTDGLGFVFGNAEQSHIVYVDDIRLSDSLTVEHNTLGPGVIGHIMRNRTWDAGTLARTDRWFHYDQVGTVISTTDADGAAADMNWFDAFGNRLEDWETGLVASGGGWGLHTKSRDPLAAMHYMSQRWYAADLGVFVSVDRHAPMREPAYRGLRSNPAMLVDPTGTTIDDDSLSAEHQKMVSDFISKLCSMQEGASVVNQLASSSNVHRVTSSTNPAGTPALNVGNNGSGTTTGLDLDQIKAWSARMSEKFDDTFCSALAHEFLHASRKDSGRDAPVSHTPVSGPPLAGGRGGNWSTPNSEEFLAQDFMNQFRDQVLKCNSLEYGP